MRDPSLLSDTELLLLLDMCLSAEKRCDDRIATAIRQQNGGQLSYLQPLKQHYQNARTGILAVLFERGHTQEAIDRQLHQLPQDRPSIEP